MVDIVGSRVIGRMAEDLSISKSNRILAPPAVQAPINSRERVDWIGEIFDVNSRSQRSGHGPHE